MMAKLERLGCPKPVVGLVVPTGYSFNLDGTSIYMTMAAMFVAQASGVHLSFGSSCRLLGVLLLTSKGAAAVTGGGFVTLAATLSAFPNDPGRRAALLARRRSVHVRGARDHQPHRQRRRDDGRRALGGSARHGEGESRARARRARVGRSAIDTVAGEIAALRKGADLGTPLKADRFYQEIPPQGVLRLSDGLRIPEGRSLAGAFTSTDRRARRERHVRGAGRRRTRRTRRSRRAACSAGTTRPPHASAQPSERGADRAPVPAARSVRRRAGRGPRARSSRRRTIQ